MGGRGDGETGSPSTSSGGGRGMGVSGLLGYHKNGNCLGLTYVAFSEKDCHR